MRSLLVCIYVSVYHATTKHRPLLLSRQTPVSPYLLAKPDLINSTLSGWSINSQCPGSDTGDLKECTTAFRPDQEKRDKSTTPQSLHLDLSSRSNLPSSISPNHPSTSTSYPPPSIPTCTTPLSLSLGSLPPFHTRRSGDCDYCLG